MDNPPVAFPGTLNRKYKNTQKIHGNHGKTMENNKEFNVKMRKRWKWSEYSGVHGTIPGCSQNRAGFFHGICELST